MMDFVYIVKKSETNEDLRYSLRSIAKFYPDHKVWIVGYKPTWVQNVNYIPVKQTKDKWKNSVLNIQTACTNENISDDFILMNDDFFCIKPILPLETVCNANLGKLTTSVKIHNKHNSKWHKAFKLVNDLLKKIGVNEPNYDYEAHLPLQINKKKYLEVMNLSEVQDFIKSKEILHKRTLYKNYDKAKESMSLSSDIKITQTLDDSYQRVKICGWLSVFDGQVRNPKFNRLNTILRTNFPYKCKYEVGYDPNRINPILENTEIVLSAKKIPDKSKGRDRFLHF